MMVIAIDDFDYLKDWVVKLGVELEIVDEMEVDVADFLGNQVVKQVIEIDLESVGLMFVIAVALMAEESQR